MPIVSCCKRLSIHICISFHKLGVARHSIRRKKIVIIIYTFQGIKPLHCTFGSPMSTYYEDLVYVSLAPKNLYFVSLFRLHKNLQFGLGLATRTDEVSVTEFF